MRKLHFPLIISFVAACGGSTTLDLGHSAPPWYATPETIAAEDNAPVGVPTVIATHQQGVIAITVDDTRVYWANYEWNAGTALPNGFVRSCVKTDCAGTLVEYTRPGEALAPYTGQLLVNRSRVFWESETQPPSLCGCSIEGCPASGPTTFVRTDRNSFAVDDEHLYWESDDATIWRCSVDDCTQRELIVLLDARPDLTFGPPVVDATQIYWFDTDGASNVIKAAPKDGSAMPRTIVARVVSPNHLAIDATDIYWMESRTEGMVVKSCPLGGCSGEPIVVASEALPRTSPQFEFEAGALTVSEKEAFWVIRPVGLGWPTPEGLGTIRACPTSGCGANATTRMDHQTGLDTIAVDKTHIYWTSATPSAESVGVGDSIVQRIRRLP